MHLFDGWQKLTALDLREYQGRECLGDDLWRTWKYKLDRLLARRNAIAGKPTEEQRLQLIWDKAWIEFYRAFLYPMERS